MAAVTSSPVLPVPRAASGWTAVLLAVLSLGALAVVAAQVGDVDVLGVLATVDLAWAGAAVGLAAVSFLGAAWNLMGFASVRVGLLSATAAQLAGGALRVVTPAGVGAVAVNARLLQRAGAPLPAAVGSVAASQVVQLVSSVLVVAALFLVPGAGATVPMPDLGGFGALTVGALAVATVALAVLAWWLRPRWTVLRRVLVGTVAPLVAALRSWRLGAVGVGGSVLITVALAGALVASVRAVHGDLGLLDALLVLTVGVSVGSLAPTPGGVGGVEVALTASLVAVGVPAATAVPAVVLYRLLTLWLPVPFGVAALAWLRRSAAL